MVCREPDRFRRIQPAFLNNYLLHHRIPQCLRRYARSASLNVLG
jgi:hypothetical protein